MDERIDGDEAPVGVIRRIEVHFAADDQAMVLELSEDPDRRDVESLIGVLEADDIDDAERQLEGAERGPRAVARIGTYRRW
jgi:hypothetical protein